MGSRSEKRQPGALVGEKSQTVYSANWKLDTMLQKNLQMLDVCKHRVSHRISMDQKIANKRFQTKLHRSKVTHARMTGNKELLRELIHRDNHNFNTSVGGRDDKYTVKISPTHTPNQQLPEETIYRKTLKYGNGKGFRPAATPVVVVEADDNNTIQGSTAVYRQGEAVVCERKRPSSSVSITPRTITKRPATAFARPKHQLQSTLQVDTKMDTGQMNEQYVNHEPDDTSQGIHVKTSNRHLRIRPKTAMPGLSKTTYDKPNRPNTALARPPDGKHLKAPSPVGQNSSQTRANSATQRRRTPCKQKHTMPSIFGEDKRPTLLDLNKERLVRANFPDRVKNFAGTLKDLQTDPDQTVDYYTLRLLENLQCAGRKGPREFIESEAERRDADRSIGNLNALNMTFAEVSMDFSDHFAKHNSGWLVKATLRAWESDDDDDS